MIMIQYISLYVFFFILAAIIKIYYSDNTILFIIDKSML